MFNIYIKTLGCPKNEVDSQYMYGLLESNDNFKMVKKAKMADVIVVNTCGFINDAKEESIETIFDAIYYKENGNCSSVIVTGCLVQRYEDEIIEEIPEIDAILGTGNFDRLPYVIEKVMAGKSHYEISDPYFEYKADLPRHLSNNYSAYLKIAEGCNNNCTYCIIPQIRGRLNSRSIEDIISEARRIIKDGVKEIIIIAQDITQYGVDLYGEGKLVPLLKKIVELDGLKWVRLMYAYPERITDDLIELIKQERKICNYLDIPIQHSSEGVRKKMGRKGDKKDLIDLIDKIRSGIPDIVLRTSLIVGFPGTQDSDFKNLVNFVDKIKFDRLGVFKYSREEDTPAYHMDDQISDSVKEKRYERIMEKQGRISLKKNKEFVGSELEVVVTEKKKDYWIARSQYDAPDIDNQIYLKGDGIKVGDFVNCKINEAYEYDLFATKIGES